LVHVKQKTASKGKYTVRFTLPASLAPASYTVEISLDVAQLGDQTPADGIAQTAGTILIK
jgi:hypothetical protein